jgi:hypothetical protein
MPATAAGAPASSRLTSKESPISPAPHNDPDLDSLIEEITVDAYNEDEQLMGFENAFDEANFPCPGTVVGEDIEVLSVTIANDRRDLIAACQRNGKRYQIALLDIDIDTNAETSRLGTACQGWAIAGDEWMVAWQTQEKPGSRWRSGTPRMRLGLSPSEPCDPRPVVGRRAPAWTRAC